MIQACREEISRVTRAIATWNSTLRDMDEQALAVLSAFLRRP